MTATEFAERIEKHPQLEGVGLTDDGMVIRKKEGQLTTLVPVKMLESVDWDTMEKILLGEREPKVLNHMSRVVGYFSRIENWNRSKVGELHDRRKGNYVFQEA